MMIGIYGVYNTTKNKWYVGSSNNIESRLDIHIKSVKDKTGIFSSIDEDDDFEFKVLKELKSENALEAWENYFIGKYDSFENGYNKRIAFRKSTFIIDSFNFKDSELCIMDDNDLMEFLKIESQTDFDDLKTRIPQFKISKNVARYDKQSVINFLYQESLIRLKELSLTEQQAY